LGVDALDALSSPESRAVLAKRLRERTTKLKPLLMDQTFVAGLGNIYSDEILWAAGLRYDRASETVSTQEVRRLYRAIGEVLQEAIKLRGSSLPDEQYRDLYGNIGQAQTEHKVYGREGQPCHRCRHTIERVKWQGRSAFYCPGCQV
jgi:formamidopyrimidine-DNA glycosylase